MNAKQLGRNIKRFREEAGMSQQSLAEQLSISFQQLQKYEYGQSKITVERLITIAQILHTSILELTSHSPESAQQIYSAESEKFGPFERVLVNQEEIQLLKAFRRIGNKRVRSMLVQHTKQWVEAERELMNRSQE